MKKALISAAAAAVALTGLLLPAGQAKASTFPCAPSTGSIGGSSQLSRPDSGGNGFWADDNGTRTVKYTLTGQTDGIYSYAAVVCDGGTFTTRAGAFTPNQGGANLGDTISSTSRGQFSGVAYFQFTADQPLDVTLIPVGDPGTPTSQWYTQAFPAGTVFGGPGLLNTWSWTYQLVKGFNVQNWTDAAANSGGQTVFAGNITG